MPELRGRATGPGGHRRGLLPRRAPLACLGLGCAGQAQLRRQAGDDRLQRAANRRHQGPRRDRRRGAGDLFDGGAGENDSASFARIRNSGVNVKATIGGAVVDPELGNCNAGRIEDSVEKIEGSSGRDVLIGSDQANTLLGRGGDDVLDGRGGFDRCIEGGGSDRMTNCEFDSWRMPLRKRIR